MPGENKKNGKIEKPELPKKKRAAPKETAKKFKEVKEDVSKKEREDFKKEIKKRPHRRGRRGKGGVVKEKSFFEDVPKKEDLKKDDFFNDEEEKVKDEENFFDDTPVPEPIEEPKKNEVVEEPATPPVSVPPGFFEQSVQQQDHQQELPPTFPATSEQLEGEQINPFTQNPFEPAPQVPPVEPSVPEPQQVSPVPANPFEVTAEPPKQPEEELPPPQYEKEQKKEIEKKPEDEKKDQSAPLNPFDSFQSEPKPDTKTSEEEENINPFDTEIFPSSMDEEKPLNDKPLEEIKDKDKETPLVNEWNRPTPEEKGESEEKQPEEKFNADYNNPFEQKKTSFEEVSDHKSVIDVPAEDVSKEKAPEMPTPETPLSQPAPAEQFKEEFWDMLENAGITKGKIVGFLVVIILGIVGVVGYLNNWFGIRGGGDMSEEVENTTVITPEEEDNYQPSQAFGLVTSYIVGLEYSKPKTPIEAEPITTYGTNAGIRTSFIFGNFLSAEKEKFIQFVDSLRKMHNLYNTDVYAFINLSVDRRAALTSYLNDLQKSIADGERIIPLLDSELARMDAQFAPITEQKNTEEQDFFTYLDTLQGQKAYKRLNDFIESSKETSQLRANYNAYKTLREMYVTALNALKPRYDDVKVNFEAVIKGIHVFDIPDSDINAIIPLERE